MPEREKPAGSQPCRFQVVRIEKTGTPEGGSGQTWYRYVLENGRSTITGQRCGDRTEVTAYAERYAEQLNVRGASGQSAWSPHAKKPA